MTVSSRHYLEQVDLLATIRQAIADVQAGAVPTDARIEFLTAPAATAFPHGILDQTAWLEGVADTAPDHETRVAALTLARLFRGILAARLEGAAHDANQGAGE